MRTVAIIQARYGSSRLPGKVLLDIAGKPMLAWVVERTRMAHLLDEVVVATTTDSSDDAVAETCSARGFPFVRGSLYDVLDRYYLAAKETSADVIVRITADCPLIDAGEIDHTLAEFIRREADFAANRLPPPWKRTYPIGLDTEVCTFLALEDAWRNAGQGYEREHVMPYLYMHSPVVDAENFDGWSDLCSGQFRVLYINSKEDLGSQRWTVDTPEDLLFVRQVFSRLEGRDDFTWQDVLQLLKREPQLLQINAVVQPKTVQDVDERSAIR